MKIAFITDDGKNISAHFGRAPYYQVIEVEAGKETHRDLREKLGHMHFQSEGQHEEHSGEQHGFSPESQSRHAAMLGAIQDCDVVIGGGMGRGALINIQESGKEVFLTDVSDIDQALQLYLAGNLPNRQELSH